MFVKTKFLAKVELKRKNSSLFSKNTVSLEIFPGFD